MRMNRKYLERLAFAVYRQVGVAVKGAVKEEVAAWVRGTSQAIFDEWPEPRLVRELEGMAESDLAMGR